MSKISNQTRNNKVTSLAAKPMISGKYLNAKNITTQIPINSNISSFLYCLICVYYKAFIPKCQDISHPIGQSFAHRNQALTNY